MQFFSRLLTTKNPPQINKTKTGLPVKASKNESEKLSKQWIINLK